MSNYSPEEQEVFGKMRIVILSPIAHVEPKWVRSVVNMVGHSWKHGLSIEEMGITERSVVDWARNELTNAALERKEFTHFLWLDSDHVFNPDLGCQLARHMRFSEVDMVSALYFNRTEPYLPVAYVKDTLPSDYTYYPLIQVPNCLCEVDAVGFGALLMKREVMEKVPGPWFTIDARGGEDIVFCTHAKKHGIRIYVDGQYKLGHFGDKQIITEKEYKAHLAAHPEKFGDKIKIGLGGIAHNG